MKIVRKSTKGILLLLLAIQSLLTGCVDPETANSNSNQANTNIEAPRLSEAKDDIDELLNHVRLPELPNEAVWQESEMPNSQNKKLTAVLKYDSENVKKLLAVIEKNRQPGQVELEVETWFPEELTAQAQLSGTESLKGTPFGANDFFNIPYGFGRLVQIENTNYFVLEVATQ